MLLSESLALCLVSAGFSSYEIWKRRKKARAGDNLLVSEVCTPRLPSQITAGSLWFDLTIAGEAVLPELMVNVLSDNHLATPCRSPVVHSPVRQPLWPPTFPRRQFLHSHLSGSPASHISSDMKPVRALLSTKAGHRSGYCRAFSKVAAGQVGGGCEGRIRLGARWLEDEFGGGTMLLRSFGSAALPASFQLLAFPVSFSSNATLLQ
ncbi:hypothetical protein PM082_004087 [Marasmius tenuissimus]|nr:hypothetical protein PM082_004087 [Marasmius tenuissimus]